MRSNCIIDEFCIIIIQSDNTGTIHNEISSQDRMEKLGMLVLLIVFLGPRLHTVMEQGCQLKEFLLPVSEFIIPIQFHKMIQHLLDSDGMSDKTSFTKVSNRVILAGRTGRYSEKILRDFLK
jgi:hypothetical protein